jgi:hypothetical protein
MQDDIPLQFRTMSRSGLELTAIGHHDDPQKVAHAKAELHRRDAEERDKLAQRQERTAWAAVAAAGLAAIATVALAVIAWVQTFGGVE